eukprot:9416740-Pyramimonas_sp.AAC.2
MSADLWIGLVASQNDVLVGLPSGEFGARGMRRLEGLADKRRKLLPPVGGVDSTTAPLMARTDVAVALRVTLRNIHLTALCLVVLLQAQQQASAPPPPPTP